MKKQNYKNYKDIQILGKEKAKILKVEFVKKIQSRKWFITKNNYSKLQKSWIIKEIDLAKTYALCFEVGKISKLEHFHAYLEYKNPKELGYFENGLGDAQIAKAKGTAQQCLKYCDKGDLYKTNIKRPIKLILLERTKFYPWQESVMTIIATPPNDRTVNWFWKHLGKQGKTQLCKYLIVKEKALIIGGRYEDIINGLNNYHEEHNEYPTVVIMNLARNNQNVSYSGIESIKDGLCVNTKYKCAQHVFNSPHIFVFANIEPDKERLSLDRWNIVGI